MSEATNLEATNIEVEKKLTQFEITFDLGGHAIRVEGHQGLAANQYRLFVDGEKIDQVDKSMGTHRLHGKAGEQPFAIVLKGSARNKTYLEVEGAERQELLKTWAA